MPGLAPRMGGVNTMWYAYLIELGTKEEWINGRIRKIPMYRVSVVGSLEGKTVIITMLYGYKGTYGIPVRLSYGRSQITREYQALVRYGNSEITLDGRLAMELRQYMDAIVELIRENDWQPVILPSNMPLVREIVGWLSKVSFSPLTT